MPLKVYNTLDIFDLTYKNHFSKESCDHSKLKHYAVFESMFKREICKLVTKVSIYHVPAQISWLQTSQLKSSQNADVADRKQIHLKERLQISLLTLSGCKRIN